MTEQAFVQIDTQTRDEQCYTYIEQNGWGDAEIDKLGADAGSRRYFHLKKQSGETAFLMDMPFEFLKLKEFLLIGDVLTKAGAKTPDIYAVDQEQGFAIIEDLGARPYDDLFDHQGVEKEPYILKALEALIHVQKNIDIVPLQGKLMEDEAFFKFELSSFMDWFYPAVKGHEASSDMIAEYQAIWDKLFKELPEPPFKTLAQMDYHAPNLLDIEKGQGIQQVGMIDFQDGVITSPMYDLMSLLEDDRRDLDITVRQKALALYKKAFSDIDPVLIDLHLAFYSAQRHCKNMGNFLRIVVQKHNDQFLEYFPYCQKWFLGSVSHPYLAPIKQWLDKHVPEYTQPLDREKIRKWKR